MPRIITCKWTEKRCRLKCLQLQWDVGSDDFFLPAIVAIALGFFNILLLLAVLYTLYFRKVCLHLKIPPLLYAPLFALITIEVAFILIEGVILIVSTKGTIMDAKPRRIMSKLIYIRLVIAVLELFARISSTVGVWHPSVTSLVHACSDFGVGLHFAQAIVLFLLVLYLGFLIKVLTYIDPLGCCSPGLLELLPTKWEEKKFTAADQPNDDGDDIDGGVRHNEYHSTQGVPYWRKKFDIGFGGRRVEDLEDKYLKGHSSSNVEQTRMLRRLQILFCCLGVEGQTNRDVAMEDIARTLYTLFGNVDLVLTDVIAGLFLLNQDQRRRKAEHISINEKFRKGMLKVMPGQQRFNRNPQTMTPVAKPFNFGNLEDQLLFEDLVHYMHYAMGMYGWPLHVFDHLCCGFCELCTVTCCKCRYRCLNKRAKSSFIKEDCCMCGAGTIQLRTGIPLKNILFANYKNKINKVPFSVCVDDDMKAIVVCVRGTLSIKDALTDMSFSPVPVCVPAREQTFVHGGMMRSAEYIKKKLDKKRILEEAFAVEGRQGYQLVVTGHSLGGGVASVLALLLKLDKKYPMMVCYAYSPPGALFSYPLADYAKDFIYTVVVGNDIIPRFTPQSLVYLKVSVGILLERCNKPKYQVLFHQRCCRRVQECCCGRGKVESKRVVVLDGDDEVNSETSGGGDDACGYDEDEAIEEVLNKNTTHKSLQESLFNRSTSVQPTGLFSRSVSTSVQQEFSKKFKRAISIDVALTNNTPQPQQRPQLISHSAVIEDTDSDSIVESPFERSLSTAATEGVLSSELFTGTEGTPRPLHISQECYQASFDYDQRWQWQVEGPEGCGGVVADSESAVVATPMTSMDIEKKMKENVLAHKGDVFLPFFPPGRVIHIDEESEDENGVSCCGSNQQNFIVQDVANEELCVIVVERGMIEHHLPNYVMNVLEVCKRRHLLSHEKYDKTKVDKLRGSNETLRSSIREALLNPDKKFQFLKRKNPSVTPHDHPDGVLEQSPQEISARRAILDLGLGLGGVRGRREVKRQPNLHKISESSEGEMTVMTVSVEVHEPTTLESHSHNSESHSCSTPHPLTVSQHSPNVNPNLQIPPEVNSGSTASPNRSRADLHLPLEQDTAARKMTFAERKKAAKLHVKISNVDLNEVESPV